MRLTIKNTNVVFNMAITLGIILIPSDMIILKERVAGYNNILTLATKDMKFGVNEDINYVEPSEDITPKVPPNTPTTTQEVLKTVPKTSVSETTVVLSKTNNETVYLLGSAATLGFLVVRYVI